MTLYLLCGLAFSGKSTLAAAMAADLGAEIVSLDELNAARGLHGGLGIPDSEWGRSHQEAKRLVEAALAAGRSVIVDDTNCFRFLRDAYRAVADRCRATTTVVQVDVPLAVALARLHANAAEPRRAPVAEAILTDLVEKFEWPQEDERVVVYPAGAPVEAWIREKLYDDAQRPS